MKEDIEKLEAQKLAIQQQAAFELGKIQGRIELLKEQAAKESTDNEKTPDAS